MPDDILVQVRRESEREKTGKEQDIIHSRPERGEQQGSGHCHGELLRLKVIIHSALLSILGE